MSLSCCREIMSPRQFAMFYVITTNHGLFQPAPGMEDFCVSKCLPVPENGMNIELFAVNYSDFDFSMKKISYYLQYRFCQKFGDIHAHIYFSSSLAWYPWYPIFDNKCKFIFMLMNFKTPLGPIKTNIRPKWKTCLANKIIGKFCKTTKRKFPNEKNLLKCP